MPNLRRPGQVEYASGVTSYRRPEGVIQEKKPGAGCSSCQPFSC